MTAVVQASKAPGNFLAHILGVGFEPSTSPPKTNQKTEIGANVSFLSFCKKKNKTKKRKQKGPRGTWLGKQRWPKEGFPGGYKWNEWSILPSGKMSEVTRRNLGQNQPSLADETRLGFEKWYLTIIRHHKCACWTSIALDPSSNRRLMHRLDIVVD